MATPQLEDGHTKIANEIIEALCRVNLTGYENRIVWCIIRRTYGWGKKSDRISYSQFEADTGIHHRHISRTLSSLKHRGVILCSGQGYNLTYGLQKDYEKWDKFSTVQGTDSAPSEVPNPGGNLAPILAQSAPILAQSTPSEVLNSAPSEVHTKEKKDTLTKDNIQKKGISVVLPDGVKKEIWDDFLEVRKKKHAPPTDAAVLLLYHELKKLKDAGNDPNEVVKQSIMRGWTGLFPLKKYPLPAPNAEKYQGGNHGTNQGRSQDDHAARRSASIGAPLTGRRD